MNKHSHIIGRAASFQHESLFLATTDYNHKTFLVWPLPLSTVSEYTTNESLSTVNSSLVTDFSYLFSNLSELIHRCCKLPAKSHFRKFRQSVKVLLELFWNKINIYGTASGLHLLLSTEVRAITEDNYIHKQLLFQPTIPTELPILRSHQKKPPDKLQKPLCYTGMVQRKHHSSPRFLRIPNVPETLLFFYLVFFDIFFCIRYKQSSIVSRCALREGGLLLLKAWREEPGGYETQHK